MEYGRSSSPSEPEHQGELYRELANREGDAQREFSQQSRDAWASNDRAKAKEFSIAAKTHFAAMENYNARAAAETFNFNNPLYQSDPENGLVEIDLHGLRVNEAVSYLERHLALCESYGIRMTTIVTGKGLHSVGGAARIRPEVVKLLRSRGMEFVEGGEGDVSGAFVIEL